MSESTESLYPMRINKYIALKHNLTRRAADGMIEKKLVKIGTRIAVLGDKVTEKDIVTVDSKDVQKIKHTYMYFAYNKPRGVLTHSATGKETDIMSALLKDSSIAPHVTKQLFPIGRLDKKSEGLIILTNDGRLSDKLLSPEYVHEKEYIVTTNQKLPSYFKQSMEKGVNIGDYVTKPCKIELMGPKTFSIVLTEGKKHQIRRMCEVMHTDVDELKRIRIMSIHLASLKPNEARKIEGKPLTDFLKSLKVN
jgi:23S rRNA pseudouridine2604 synthase